MFSTKLFRTSAKVTKINYVAIIFVRQEGERPPSSFMIKFIQMIVPQGVVNQPEETDWKNVKVSAFYSAKQNYAVRDHKGVIHLHLSAPF